MYFIARYNAFGLKDALRAAVGLKPFRRTPLINLGIVVTLLGPLSLAVWIVQTCPH